MSDNPIRRIRKKERDAVLQSLRAGVVPRIGLQHVQVGRTQEITALMQDIQRIVDGGSAIRFVIGEYGAGKSFFLNLARSIALEHNLVTVHADLSPDRRLQASGGQAQSLYAEMLHNLSTRSKPDGGAAPVVVERFAAECHQLSQQDGTVTEDIIRARLAHLQEMTGGYDFAQVIAHYWKGHEEGNEQSKADAVRWLRGEFVTRTDARMSIGVRTIVNDNNVYDHLKLLARFARQAGYTGLLICLDELVNIYKLSNTQARNSNYEQVLRILNDCLQGTAEGIGFILGGTPEMLMDPRRGMYSYPALQSRLVENTYAVDGLVDFSGPVVRLANLTPEDVYVLLHNIRNVFAYGQEEAHLVPDEALQAFMEHCNKRIGDAYFRTPRMTVREFTNFLAVLEQNPDAEWKDLIGTVDIEPDDAAAMGTAAIPSESVVGEWVTDEDGLAHVKF